jgi:FRG domain
VPMSERPAVEKRLLPEFRRAYPPRAEIPAPDYKDDIAWMALMQHYGAPTRLLDWTFSPCVAAFFALDQLLSSLAPMAAVWALSGWPMSNTEVHAFLPDELEEPFRKYSKARDGPAFREVFLEAKSRLQRLNAAYRGFPRFQGGRTGTLAARPTTPGSVDNSRGGAMLNNYRSQY